MSGSSKSKNIKHRKDAQDAKRGRAFAKLAKAISVAARAGGDDPSKNPQLRTAIQDAKNANMPKDNVARAIEKAVGGASGDEHELYFECFGRGGVGILIKCVTDNTNRTVATVRAHLRRQDAEIAKSGALQHIFTQRGELEMELGTIDEEALFEILVAFDLEEPIEVPIEEPIEADEAASRPMVLYCEISQLTTLEEELVSAGAVVLDAQQVRVPVVEIPVPQERFARLNQWLEQLAENDDVEAVLHNAVIDGSASR